MPENAPDVSFDAIASILFEEIDRHTTLSPKAFYKIVYFIDKQLSEEGYTTSVEHFWYKYGTMAVTTGSAVAVQQSGNRSEVLCTVTPDELELNTDAEIDLRSATKDVLSEYNRVNTRGLTDRMYEEAPYDFQRRYRKLDQLIQSQITSHGERSSEFSRDEIRMAIHDFIDAFPEDEFPAFVNDLYLWYDILSTALDDNTTSLSDIEDITEDFWTIIMIEMATDPETGVRSRVFANELNIDDPSDLQGYLRYRLREFEKEYLRIGSGTDGIGEVADAMVLSQLDFAEI